MKKKILKKICREMFSEKFVGKKQIFFFLNSKKNFRVKKFLIKIIKEKN